MPRHKLVAGNWKMNTTLAEAKALARAVADGCRTVSRVDVAVCPPFPWLLVVAEEVGALDGPGAVEHVAHASGEVALGAELPQRVRPGRKSGPVRRRRRCGPPGLWHHRGRDRCRKGVRWSRSRSPQSSDPTTWRCR